MNTYIYIYKELKNIFHFDFFFKYQRLQLPNSTFCTFPELNGSCFTSRPIKKIRNKYLTRQCYENKAIVDSYRHK